MRLKKNNPGCQCCEEDEEDEASPCEACSDATPLTISLTVEGIENDTCDDCEADLNGTFGLTQTDSESCEWRSSTIANCDNSNYWYVVEWNSFDGTLEARLYRAGPLTDVVCLLYTKSVGWSFDCEATHTLEFDSEDGTWDECAMSASQPDWTVN